MRPKRRRSAVLRVALEEPAAEVEQDPLPLLGLAGQAELGQEQPQGRVQGQAGEGEQLRGKYLFSFN